MKQRKKKFWRYNVNVEQDVLGYHLKEAIHVMKLHSIEYRIQETSAFRKQHHTNCRVVRQRFIHSCAIMEITVSYF